VWVNKTRVAKAWCQISLTKRRLLKQEPSFRPIALRAVQRSTLMEPLTLTRAAVISSQAPGADFARPHEQIMASAFPAFDLMGE